MTAMDITFGTKDVKVYIAGAGSGKTYALMNELETMLKTYRPEEIAFTTFTRKGVMTGIERALAANSSLSVDDFPYFQTLHRMCFRESGLKRVNMIEPRDVLKFNALTGFKLHLSAAFNHQSDDDKMLQRYDAMRSSAKTGIYIHSIYDEERYHRLINAYEAFKKHNNLVDFYDCLTRYLEVGKPLPVAGFILDEAQDMTPLQWQVTELAARNAEKVRIGGDPAQAIFNFQGAVPETLIALTRKYETVELNDTYRLPKKICKVADSIISLMQEKLPRVHLSVKNTDGDVQEIADREALIRIVKKDFDTNDYRSGRWFFLFRTNCHIDDVAQQLRYLRVPYHDTNGFCVADRYLARLRRYMKYRELGYGTPEAKATFMRQYNIKDINDDFTESDIIPSEDRYAIQDYLDRYGLDELSRMAALPPFCLLTTPYKVKGGEADNVAVFLDATKQVGENTMIDLDGELRVFYVSCTRAKEKLYVVNAQSKYNLTSLWEATVENMEG